MSVIFFSFLVFLLFYNPCQPALAVKTFVPFQQFGRLPKITLKSVVSNTKSCVSREATIKLETYKVGTIRTGWAKAQKLNQIAEKFDSCSFVGRRLLTNYIFMFNRFTCSIKV